MRDALLTAEIEGLGSIPLKRKNEKLRWKKVIRNASLKGFEPDCGLMVTVSGPEGAMSVPLIIKQTIRESLSKRWYKIRR